jgi:hypothetical protein
MWGRFMKAATSHDKGDWYQMPPDVEKVAICRLSGARATESCKHQREMYTVARPDGVTQLVPASVISDSADAAAAQALASNEPPVYEDLFPIGAVPPEICPLHNPTANPLSLISNPESLIPESRNPRIVEASRPSSIPR